jgi:hypothetical protein
MRAGPASSVLRASPPSQSARPFSRELPVDPYGDHRWDFPCCVWSTLPACRRQYPGRSDGIYSLIRFHSLRPSPKPGRVGSCISLFEACSAFTHVTACTLAKSPSDSLHQRLQQSRCLHCCSDCYRVERTSSRAGYSRCGPPPFHGAPGNATYQSWSSRAHILTPPSLRPNFIPTESGSRALLPTISAMEGQHAD